MSDFHDTCADIMISNADTLHPDMTLNEAFAKVREGATRYFPVVDDQGDFVGIFSSMTLIKLLLPSSVSIKERKNSFDLSFMHTSIEELRERLIERGEEKISDYVLKGNFTPCSPKTSIMEALHILYKTHCHVVITEENSRRFLGVVSIRGILSHIEKAGA